jgi:hypothetical protein
MKKQTRNQLSNMIEQWKSYPSMLLSQCEHELLHDELPSELKGLKICMCKKKATAVPNGSRNREVTLDSRQLSMRHSCKYACFNFPYGQELQNIFLGCEVLFIVTTDKDDIGLTPNSKGDGETE